MPQVGSPGGSDEGARWADDLAAHVRQLRQSASARAKGRLPLPFEGQIVDDHIALTRVRRYVPIDVASHEVVLFLHGGYGIFGDLELQDNYCRGLASGSRRSVVSVDYGLAPECSFSSAVAEIESVTLSFGGSDLVLCGDSAGGALALAAAVANPSRYAALLLTNPNVDLTLSLFDQNASGGPDLETSHMALRAWFASIEATDRPVLHQSAALLPPTFIAVGDRDALLPDARALSTNCEQRGRGAELSVIGGARHGFMSEADMAGQTFRRMYEFLDHHV